MAGVSRQSRLYLSLEQFDSRAIRYPCCLREPESQSKILKEQVLGASDRAALQSLIPLAGALGAGTIFALFIGGRRKAGFAVFEVFAIAAVLAAVGTTVYFCLALLHANEPVSDRELTETATPLIVAVFLLLFISVFSRLQGSVERVIAIGPLLLIGIALGAFLASSTWTAQPEDTYLVALLILAVGMLLGLFAWGLDRVYASWERDLHLNLLKRLAGRGYQPEERRLSISIPARDAGPAGLALSCWTRKGRTFLDSTGAARLAAVVSERWHAVGSGEARAPTSATIILAAKAKRGFPIFWLRRALRISTFSTADGGSERVAELEANDDGLFDVTDLGLV
jgi:hypothetical protein